MSLMKKNNMKKPNLFILGAPKCGTTSIANYLSKHPQIFFSAEKEPHYFNKDSGHRYYFELEKYLKLFKDAKVEHLYMAEGSVWYLLSEVAVKNILEFNPDSKFIVMLRNPVDLFFSLHQELLYGGSESIKSPLEAWEMQRERLNGKKIPVGCSDPKFLNYEYSCSLGKQLALLQTIIKPENLFIITLDELKHDSNKVYIDLLKFLNINIIPLANYDVINEKKVRKSYLLSSFFKYFNQFKKKIGINKGLGLANRINRLNVKSGVSLDFENERRSMSPMLYNIFKEDVILLEKLTGKDLSNWKN